MEAGVREDENRGQKESANGGPAFPGLPRQGEKSETLRKSSLSGRTALWDEGLNLQESLKSSAECVRDADGSDVCHYGGVVCYDGGREKLVLIDDDRKGETFASEIIFQDGRWTQGR